MKPQRVHLAVALDTAEIVHQLKALRLCMSQMGHALDSAILALTPKGEEEEEEDKGQ